jgi:hypothetical protein
MEYPRTSTNGDLASVFFTLMAMLFCLRRHPLSPRLHFASAWVLRISTSFFFSFLINAACEVQRPVPLLTVTVLLVLFLLESFRLWRLTSLFSKIDVPIFPRFKQCSENFIWPIGKVFDDVRETILASGFKEKALLKIGNEEVFVIYSPVFYSRDRSSRLQIIFDSFCRGRAFLNCVITSFAANGTAIITNNLQTIFASFYPESWDVKRYPMASLADLLKMHAARISGEDTIAIDDSNSWESINSEHHQIELDNCQSGLCEKLDCNDHMTLTFSGRYHLWCDMLNYSYFGCVS